jgi:outer membrane protein assembly factor BamB
MFELKRLLLISTIMVLVFQLINTSTGKDVVFGQNWPQWRGPLSSGACPKGNPPVEWNENKNIIWKIEIPGKGYSTPIIWGNQIFLTTAIETDRKENLGSWFKSLLHSVSGEETIQTENVHEFVVLSVNRKDGKIIWECKVREQVPLVRTHITGSWASNSAVTDGIYVYAYFGSHGLYCLDLQGNILWERDFGKMDKGEGFGEGSSPTLYNDKLVILRDHEGQSNLIMLNKKTGKTIWEVDRDVNTSWSSPLVVDVGGVIQVITTATNWVRSYDLNSGRLIWECSGLSGYPIPTPIASNGLIYVMNGFEGNIVLAIRPGEATGNITGSKSVVWKYNESAPYTPSALLVDDLLYFLKNEQGRLTCLEAKTGKEFYSSKRLRGTGNVLASPVGTRKRIYVVGLKGKTHVIKHGPKFEVLAVNKLNDHFAASPAIINDYIYLRGSKYLYCIAENRPLH